MTIKEKIRYLLRKKPYLKFNRGEFFWAWFEEFAGADYHLSKNQWLMAFTEFSAVERALRDILKEPEFKLPPEAEAQRYFKATKFKKEYQKIPIKGQIIPDGTKAIRLIYED